MKRILVFLISTAAVAAEGIADVAWMAGHWSGSLGRATNEELWMKPSGGAMLGVSRTVAGSRMVAFEFLRVVTRPEGVFYVAQPGGRPPVDFKLMKVSASEAVFENPQHDHPKMIVYRLENADTLVATIEGDEGGKHKKQEFRFQRVK